MYGLLGEGLGQAGAIRKADVALDRDMASQQVAVKEACRPLRVW